MGLIWLPNDAWKFLAMLPEPRVLYSPCNKLDFWVGGQLTGGTFRTDHSDTIVPRKLDGAQVDYSDYRVGGGLIYSPSDAFMIDVGGGYSIQRKFDFHRAGIDYQTDPAPYFRIEFKAKF